MTDEDNDHRTATTSAGEWMLGTIGALIVAALMTLFIHQAVVRDGPPRLEVTVLEIDHTDAGFVASVMVENTGGQTAENAHLIGEVTDSGSVVETASTTIDYVSPGSRRRATLVLSTDPLATGADPHVSVDAFTPM